MVETISVAISDSSDVLCFDLYLINVFEKSPCKGREVHRRYVQADTLLFTCYC